MVAKGIHPLSCGKHKLLEKSSEGNKISLDDKFSFNTWFKSASKKISIPSVQEKSVKYRDKVDEDREHAIQGQVVRLMKARKFMAFDSIIQEVQKSLVQFHPEIKVESLAYS